MFSKASDIHPKTLRNVSNGQFFNALPVPCSLQVFFLLVFLKENVGFLVPGGSQDGPPTWTEVGPRLGGVLEAFLGGSWGLLGGF